MMQAQTIENIIANTEQWLQEYKRTVPYNPGEFFFEYGQRKQEQIQRVRNKVHQRNLHSFKSNRVVAMN